MEDVSLLRFAVALVFVLGLIGLLAISYKKIIVNRDFPGLKQRRKRLSVQETLLIDSKRKVMIVRRDDVEHLVLIGATGETVLESGFKDNSQPLENGDTMPRLNLVNK